MTDTIIRCASCEGFGWVDSDEGDAEDCTWCGGVGYVYHTADGLDRKIPDADFTTIADQLETLERERLHEMGYTGEAKKPWEQAVRKKPS